MGGVLVIFLNLPSEFEDSILLIFNFFSQFTFHKYALISFLANYRFKKCYYYTDSSYKFTGICNNNLLKIFCGVYDIIYSLSYNVVSIAEYFLNIHVHAALHTLEALACPPLPQGCTTSMLL
jgi:hypothetical protein